jgi:dTMP kinase
VEAAKNTKNVTVNNMRHFYCLEGIDGSGKSTQLNALEENLKTLGYECERIRELGGTALSEAIRELLLSPAYQPDNMTELLLYNAARAQVIAEKILPALKAGKIVLADRYAWSTMAYQGYGRQLDKERIRSLLEITCGEVWPQHTFVLDIPVETFRQRSDDQGRTPDRLEQEKESFFMAVRQGYQNMAKEYDSIHLLNGTLSPEEVQKNIINIIKQDLEA